MAAVPQAVQLALELARAPALAKAMRRQRLPHDVLVLIRIAAGCEETTGEAARRTGASASAVVAAAGLYLQQVLLFPGADSYRTLGAAPEAPHETLQEHMRWMMRWVHPDRTRSDWESVFAQRVLKAWDDLKTPERRQAYDAANRRPPPRQPRHAVRDGTGHGRRRRSGRSPGLPWLAVPLERRRRSSLRFWFGTAAMLALVLGLTLWFTPLGDWIGLGERAEQAVAGEIAR